MLRFEASAIERWPLDRLLPFATNARQHSADQVARIAASMVQFGFVTPCLVDADGVLIAGHGRLLAARQLGLADVPVIRIEHLSEAEVRGLRLTDNRLGELSTWDEELLATELKWLQDEGFNVDVTGFADEDVQRLLAGLDEEEPCPGGDEDAAAPKPPAEPVSRTGDLWLLGRHRLLCGDATVATDVERLLAGTVPHLLVTDPPYGVDYDPTWRNEAGVSASGRTGRVANDDRADWREAWALFPGDVAYVWHAGIHAATVAGSLAACGFQIRSQIVWVKPRLVLSRGHYHWQHEPCWYAVKGGATGHWQGARDQTTVWTIGAADNGEDAATVHGTQKPVECMRRPIVNNSAQGDAIYEPFAGSGSTVIAADTTGRVCLAMELDPRYVDVIIGRWQTLTGKAATLDGDGRTLAEIAAARV